VLACGGRAQSASAQEQQAGSSGLKLPLPLPFRKCALLFKAAATALVELNDGNRRPRLRQADMTAFGALFDDEV
jgi:hypothetical protein